MMNTTVKLISLCLLLYVIVLLFFYFAQEKLLFLPTKLSKDYVFRFDNPFEEKNFEVGKNISLNALLFKAKDPKGVVLFLHGNGGAIHGWGQGADIYLENNYDVLYVDYRGYGKSDGKIEGEAQLISDSQIIYDHLKKEYGEEKIIVSGTSIGTGIASQLASKNNPKKLVLISPYYSLESLIKEKVKIVPSFIIKYKLATHQFLTTDKYPILIFHGSNDELIPSHHAQQLKSKNPSIQLHILNGFGHNNVDVSPTYIRELTEYLD